MKINYKYPLQMSPLLQTVSMPEKAAIHTVASQDGRICLWAEHILTDQRIKRQFIVLATGVPIPDTWMHIGSCLMVEAA